MTVELEQGQWGTVGSRDDGGRGRGGWEDGVMWQVLDPSRSLGMTGEEGREGMGSRLGASATCLRKERRRGLGWVPQWIVSIEQGRAPLPLDPSTLLRVSGPSWGWIRASAHAKGALAASSTGSGGGMTREGGRVRVGASRRRGSGGCKSRRRL